MGWAVPTDISFANDEGWGSLSNADGAVAFFFEDIDDGTQKRVVSLQGGGGNARHQQCAFGIKPHIRQARAIDLAGEAVPFGSDLIFRDGFQ